MFKVRMSVPGIQIANGSIPWMYLTSPPEVPGDIWNSVDRKFLITVFRVGSEIMVDHGFGPCRLKSCRHTQHCWEELLFKRGWYQCIYCHQFTKSESHPPTDAISYDPDTGHMETGSCYRGDA